jgi:LacI family transcriptional regulator
MSIDRVQPARILARPPTIRDVADAAGVSVGTVSKALNGGGQLRDETRAAVHRAARDLRFRPNEMARSLSGQRRFTVGLISTDRHGRFSIPVLEGIEDALDAARISAFLCNTAGDPAREREHVRSLLARRVDGIIVTGQRSHPRPLLDVDGEPVPIVYAFARVDSVEAPCLLPDDEGGGRLAGEHLIRAGRIRIAHITGPERTEAVRHRLRGLRAALERNGLDLPPERAMSGSWSEAWGHAAVARLLAARDPIDAIFCGSDQIARGVVDALRERGVRVPEHIAIIGFDNWETIATATRPPLTTIDMNLPDLGRHAGLELLAMIEGRGRPGPRRLPCSLIVRASCGGGTADRPDRP